MPKVRMQPLEVSIGTLSCMYKEVWPPIEIEVYGSIKEAAEYLKPPEIERLQVWETKCGLHKMTPEKCTECPYVSIDGGSAKMYRERPKIRHRNVRIRGGVKPKR